MQKRVLIVKEDLLNVDKGLFFPGEGLFLADGPPRYRRGPCRPRGKNVFFVEGWIFLQDGPPKLLGKSLFYSSCGEEPILNV